MVTPVFRIFDYLKARAFYIDWLGFRIDWEELPGKDTAYLQVSRGEVILHLSGNDGDGNAGAKARIEVRGLPAYHRQLISKDYLHMRPDLNAANWHERVLEMEVIDPFGNHIIFCELGVL